MPRNMSFALTTKQIRNRSKTVTRRFGWWFLKPGDILNAVEKSMGLKKGEKIKRLAKIEVVSTDNQALYMMDDEECAKEGFPEFTPDMFIRMLQKYYGIVAVPHSHVRVNRIEFKYIKG